MVREALLLLLFRQLSIAAIIRPRKPGDVDNLNQIKSRMITEIMLKELSSQKCRLRFRDVLLSELYFHLNGTETTVHIQNPRMSPPSCAVIGHISTDVFASRMDLSLTFTALNVNGTVTFRQKSVRLSRYKENYPFGLTVRDVTCSGICFTKWTEIGYGIVDCDLRYENFSRHRLRMPEHRLPMDEDVFAEALVERMRTGMTNAMNENVAGSVNSLLRDVNVAGFLRNATFFQKYKNYIIESTESANEFVDGIMGALKKIIIERFHDSFAIPDIDEGFRRKGILVVWQGSFHADHGTIRGLSTVSRVGDTSIARDNASRTHFFGNLSFKHLDLRYDRYRAEFMNFGPTGTLMASLRPIRLHIHPYVNFETGKIHLEEFEIGDVGEFVVEVTGLGATLNWIVSNIATWVIGLTRDRILGDLQRKYDGYIRSLLSGYTIDELTNGVG